MPVEKSNSSLTDDDSRRSKLLIEVRGFFDEGREHVVNALGGPDHQVTPAGQRLCEKAEKADKAAKQEKPEAAETVSPE